MDNIWILIIFSIITIFLFRVFPFIFKNTAILGNQNNKFYKFLGYSTQGMLGMIVYNSLFEHKDIVKLLSNWNLTNTLNIAILLFIFIFVVKTNKMLSGFIISLLIYLLIVMYIL